MRARFLQSLQFRVTVVFLLVSLVPLGVVAVFSVHTADQAIESIVTNQLENVAAEKQQLLERWMAERRADLEVVARSAAVQAQDPAAIRPYLRLLEEQYQVYQRFVVAGLDGRVICDSRGGASPAVDRDPGFRQACAGQPYLSEVSLEPEGAESVFRLWTPIPGPQGTPRGAVSATVSTRETSARVLRVALGETGECYLVDRGGLFLAHRQPERILRENIAQSGSFTNLLGDHARPVYTDYRGIAVLGASRAVSGTPWFVVVEQDRDEAFADSVRLTWYLSVVIALAVGGTVALAWVLAGYVTSPVRLLSEAAHALSRGDFDAALSGDGPARGDEIGALHAAFRHMAGQLRQRHTQLQQRIGLSEAELRRSDLRLQETLQAAARSEHLAALGRLAAGVAHEIRTPLTSLKLFLQSVREEIAVTPEQSQDVTIAMQQVRRMESTINHFLDFARPRETFLSAIDFHKLLDDALLVVQPRANQQEVNVTCTVAAELPPVEGDTRQLGDALVNLLVNAMEAMPDGGSLGIAIAAEASSDGRPCGVRIDISDTGPGVPAADLDRLFEPFFTTKPAGSGLGLAIVHATLQRHRGHVTVHSRPGEGTTFMLHFPAAPA